MPRRRVEGVPITRGSDDLWRKVGEPSAGAHYRGYLRFSHEAGHYGLTTESQRAHIEKYAEARGWICDGFDLEPATTAKYEEIERRPVFRRHLELLETASAASNGPTGGGAGGASGGPRISLCYMADRWARNKIVAYVSLSRLRRAGVWWATSDGRWTIDRTEEDGWDVAFAVEVSLNAGYSRRLSEKFRNAKNTRAHLGFHNGDLMYGYLRPADPPRPEGAPFTWKPPRQAPVRHPVDFDRLQQIGAWAAAGYTDRQIAEKCNALGWRLPGTKPAGPRLRYAGEDGETGEELRTFDVARPGPRPFSKDTIRVMLIRPFPRAFSPTSTRGTILAPDGTRVEGQHPAAWEWELWHRIDEQRRLRGVGGSRGQVVAAVAAEDDSASAAPASSASASAAPAHEQQHRNHRPYRVWPFSGIVVCAACGSRLRAHSARRGAYPSYRDTARSRGFACPMGGHAYVKAALLDEQFAALLSLPLPSDWRERIAAIARELEHTVDWAGVEQRRRSLVAERERLKTQHRYGLVTDEELVREAERLRQALDALPSPDTQGGSEAERLLEAGETIAQLTGYWESASAAERAELVRLLLVPEGLRYDLAARRIVGLRPRATFVPLLRLALGVASWSLHDDGWLVTLLGRPDDDDQPATYTTKAAVVSSS